MRWPPNPYAVAELLSGKRLGASDGKDADDFLRAALFNERARAQLARMEVLAVDGGALTIDAAFNLFAKIAALYDGPLTLEKARQFPLVKIASDIYGAPEVDKLLPYLLQITDAEFSHEIAPPAVPNIAAVQVDASYAATGALVDTVSYTDPNQGLTGDCYLIAAMIALAWTVPARLTQSFGSCGYVPPQVRDFKWQFHEEGQSLAVKVSGRVPADNGVLTYAKSEPPGEFWPSLVEKAYVVRKMTLEGTAMSSDGITPREPRPADYQAIGNYEKPWHACRQLAGGTVKVERHNTDLHGLVFSQPAFISVAGKATLPLLAMTREQIQGHDATWHDSGLFIKHAYAVLGKMPSGHIVLRNPHGRTTVPRNGYVNDGLPWNCGEPTPVELNKLGVFAIEPALFNKCFKWAGWVTF